MADLKLPVVDDGLLGESSWLAWAAMLWAWSNEVTFGERFVCAQRLIQHLQEFADGSPKKSTSYQAFLKMLIRWTALLVLAVQVTLRNRMQSLTLEDWRQHGLIVFAVDGSKIELPRTTSNQQAYAQSRQPSNRRRRKKHHDRSANNKVDQSQFFITQLYHLVLRISWDW